MSPSHRIIVVSDLAYVLVSVIAHSHSAYLYLKGYMDISTYKNHLKKLFLIESSEQEHRIRVATQRPPRFFILFKDMVIGFHNVIAQLKSV